MTSGRTLLTALRMRRMRGSVLAVTAGALSVTPGKSKKIRGGSSAAPDVGSGSVPVPSIVTTTVDPLVPLVEVEIALIAIAPAVCPAASSGHPTDITTIDRAPHITRGAARAPRRAITRAGQTVEKESDGHKSCFVRVVACVQPAELADSVPTISTRLSDEDGPSPQNSVQECQSVKAFLSSREADSCLARSRN